jgi:hypothetical protein
MNDIDVIFKVVDKSTSKWSMIGGTKRLAGLQVDLAGPTYHPLEVCHGGCLLVSSRVF